MKRLIAFTATLLVTIFGTLQSSGQTSTTGANTISTGVPFLTIAPDSRAGAMGDAGVATSPDMNSQHWNAAKYAFIESDMGVGLSYTPWLRKIVTDVNLAYLVGYKRLDEYQTLSASLRYFALGDVTFRDNQGEFIRVQKPNEFAIDFGYTRLLSEVFSGSVVLRYIRSDLTGGQEVNGAITYPGNTYAADIAFYYRNEISRNRRTSIITSGIDISNIGGKISYTDGAIKDFIPANLRLGAGYETEIDEYNTISFNIDLNKLLVPTPNIDSLGANGVIIGGGFSEDKSVISGIFSSFTDAPGGFKEELQEINISFGMEYWYNKQFALRAGYFHENENKGNRKFITAGAGLKLNVFSLDFSYLMPTVTNHPLANTLRFSLSFDFEAFNNQR